MPATEILTAGAVGFLSSGKRCGVIGDSISADAKSLTSSGALWNPWGFLTWMRRAMGRRVDLTLNRVYAVGGKTVAEMRSEQLPSALADDLDLCIVHGGRNGISGTAGVKEAIVADLEAIYDALRENGTFVVAIPIRTVKSGAGWTTDTFKAASWVNKWIRDYCRTHRGTLCIDVNPIYMDFATGYAKAAYLRDNTHDSQASAKVMGEYLASILNPLMPDVALGFSQINDVYDASTNPTGNLLANGLLAGTTGTELNGATGDSPNSWGWMRDANAGSVTVVGSKEAHASFTGLEWAAGVHGGTGTNGMALRQAITTNFAPGDVVYSECEVAYDVVSTDIATIYSRLYATVSGVAAFDSWDGYLSTVSNGLMPTGAGTAYLRTDPFVIPADVNALQFFAGTKNDSSGAAPNATLKVLTAAVRKVV